ncbi:hypothetical protein ACFV4I_02360 [Nocardiopsis alba]|uniref:Uncharacterized protein n=1 Tax=Nocardiopsis alba TaxID=53437 RepID=A0A7K2IZ98_9ACTN|nr:MULTISPECIES: hypothetical protein [Nocardiopsis]MEC3891526.1 hypothetical protein [Nocardiopsis sp. LDBS1602]MYR35137.1 hypothetical protein [Nocardiopsis alba]
MRKWWKTLGLAAFVGVAATGAAIARAERRRRAYTPDQVRERLHERAALARAAGAGTDGAGPASVARDGARPLRERRETLRGRVTRTPPVAAIGRLLRRADPRRRG